MENNVGVTSCFDLKKAFGTSPTSASYTAKAPTTTKPTTAATSLTSGFHDISEDGASRIVQSFIGIIPYATAANNVTFNMRVWGWKRWATSSANAPWLYIPRLLLDVACTAGNIAGTSSLDTNSFLADTITLTLGDSTALLVSPVNDLGASIKLDVFGSQFIEFDFNTNSSATAMNALWWPVS